EGEHVSTDLAVQAGRVMWLRHSLGTPAEGGTFDYWTIEAAARAPLEEHLGGWVAQQLATYTGMLNLETIGGRIIDAHLRFADQWPDLYGAGWLPAVVGLYEHGVWRYARRDRRIGYSVALFGPHGREYQHPSASLVEQARRAVPSGAGGLAAHAGAGGARQAPPGPLGGRRRPERRLAGAGAGPLRRRARPRERGRGARRPGAGGGAQRAAAWRRRGHAGEQ